MARKRGGLAGFYDRNKGVLKKAVPAALSFIPGVGIPLAATAGALMGADREGSTYFGGFDAAGALRGGLEGYGIGRGTQALAGGVKGLLTAGQGAGQAARSAVGPVAPPQAGQTFSGFQMPGQDMFTKPASQAAQNVGRLDKIENFLKAKPEIAKLGLQATLAQLPSAESRALEAQTDISQQRVDLDRRRLELEQAEMERGRERRRRVAELLMPMIQQQYGQYFGGR